MLQEATSSLLSDTDSTWSCTESMHAVRSRLQTALAPSLGMKLPKLLAVLEVGRALDAARSCSCPQLTLHKSARSRAGTGPQEHPGPGLMHAAVQSHQCTCRSPCMCRSCCSTMRQPTSCCGQSPSPACCTWRPWPILSPACPSPAAAAAAAAARSHQKLPLTGAGLAGPSCGSLSVVVLGPCLPAGSGALCWLLPTAGMRVGCRSHPCC